MFQIELIWEAFCFFFFFFLNYCFGFFSLNRASFFLLSFSSLGGLVHRERCLGIEIAFNVGSSWKWNFSLDHFSNLTQYFVLVPSKKNKSYKSLSSFALKRSCGESSCRYKAGPLSLSTSHLLSELFSPQQLRPWDLILQLPGRRSFKSVADFYVLRIFPWIREEICSSVATGL